MKKKIVSVLLACCMTFGGSVSAFAADENYIQQDTQQENQDMTVKSEEQNADQEQTSGMDSTMAEENSQDNSVTEEKVANDSANAEENVVQETTEEEQKEEGPLVSYSGHVQSYGNVKAVEDGALLGTTGQAKRLEALKIEKGAGLKKLNGDIVYRTHVQTYGTQKWVKNGELSGTTGQAKRIEGFQAYLTGDLAEKYDIYYSMHIQSYGWSKWVKGSADESGWCGSSGLAKRVEAIQIQLVKKDGGTVPENSGKYTYISPKAIGGITYSGHQQSYGDLKSCANGTVLGVTGKAKRLEAIKIALQKGTIDGSVSYRTHVQSIGWQGWKNEGELSGTTGQAKRLEAIEIKLTGDLAEVCDVWYRVHMQSQGWLGWAKNGQSAGSTGLGKRLEAIQIKIVPKGAAAPGSNTGYFVSTLTSPQQQRVNAAVQRVYNQTGRNLYKTFLWCVNNIKYVSLSYNVPKGYTTTQWYGLYGLEQHKGDCRSYAAAFYHLARGLGYNARYVYGYVPRKGGGMIDHAWVEIKENGTTYVYDPNFQHATKRNGYHFRYGTSGTWVYSNYRYVD